MKTDTATSSPAPNVTVDKKDMGEKEMTFKLNLSDRRTIYEEINKSNATSLPDDKISALRFYDLVYRTLCAVMFNHSSSGHPGGSVSSGRIVESLLLSMMRYDFSNPNDKTADFICYTAGHKALGLYAMWACRDEVMRITNPDALPETAQRIRLEDLLGFRKNPVTKTPLFKKFSSQALDGHPTPQTPFVWASTGPSGIGVTSSVGIALALKDIYGESAPYVNLIEGEGGMTPGRVSEALAAAASSGLNNIIMHVDWNQAAIDSNSVTREGNRPGDYAQWDPREFLLVHGFNVINVEDGFDFNQIHTAQEKALALETSTPTAIVYRTTKGWRYGVEGKKSHGGGHKFCSDGYYEALAPFENELGLKFPRFEGEKNAESVEKSFYDSLLVIRKAFETKSEHTGRLGKLFAERVAEHNKSQHPLISEKINLSVLYDSDKITPHARPESCEYQIGSSQTLRGALAHVLNELNRKTGGAILATAADVYGSTNTLDIGKGFGAGLWRWPDNTDSRIFSAGGITEDAIGGICSGIAAIGNHLSVGASYGAFIVPLTIISSRTHSVGQQTFEHRNPGTPYNTMIILCGHTGIKTGEDGPTHAEPNTLAMLQSNHPHGIMITLTPWDPQDLWPLVVAGLQKRPAVLAPFVTRPNEKVFDRKALGLALPEESVNGVYKLLSANGKSDGSIIYQGSDVTNVLIEGVLPRLKEKGLNLDIYYVASSELFDSLDEQTRENIFPDNVAQKAMMISGFSLPTTFRWITSKRGRDATLHPHKNGKYLGSGTGEMCIEEAGLHAEAQLDAILRFVSNK